MKNKEIAEIFYEIADILQLEEVEWKPQAYRKAARSLESIGKDVEELYKKKGEKGLEQIPGIGEGLAEKIIEYLKTGKIKEYEKLKKKIPHGLHKILEIPGIGIKKAFIFYKKLGIKNISDLERAAKKGKISKLPKFKKKTEENILSGLEFLRKSGKQERKLLGDVLPIARNIEAELNKLKEVRRVDIAGSIRRMKETVGDIDMLCVADKPRKVIDYFTTMKNVSHVLAKGTTKAMILTKEGLQADMRVIKQESYGSALHYFTGNKEHNIHLRRIAMKKGMKINEYGIFKKKGKKEIRVAGKTEVEFYKKLKLQYVPPELREDKGEIELALKKKLPKLVGYKEIKGDLHTHTKWSDGSDTPEAIAKMASKLGYDYIAICDHAGKLKIAHSLDEKRLKKQIKELDKVNKKFKIRILKGAEIDILANGSLSMPDRILKKLDIVTASVHSGFSSDEKKMTERILKALDNKYVRVLGHPTGRIIYKREGYKINLDKVFEKARERDIAMEINAFPDRLDLNDVNTQAAMKKGLKIAIGTDSHSKEHLKFMELGVGVARRGWCKSRDVLNTYSLKKLEKWLKR